MKSNLKTNFIYNSAYQMLSMIVPLVTTPYISRVLGADGVGIYSYNYSIAA
ncbi:oligosaccharide flippase family protein, partial [Enterococcus lactis]